MIATGFEPARENVMELLSNICSCSKRFGLFTLTSLWVSLQIEATIFECSWRIWFWARAYAGAQLNDLFSRAGSNPGAMISHPRKNDRNGIRTSARKCHGIAQRISLALTSI